MPASYATATLDTPASLPATSCRHCGEDCPPQPTITPDGPFCCTGCSAVYALIAAHGLGAFYTCEVPPGASQRRAPPHDRRYALLDDSEVARRLIESDRDGVVRVQFSVPTLHCASCVWLLEQLWRFDAGVVRSEVDLLRRVVSVEFRSAGTSLRAVAERLASLGYAPLVDAERSMREIPTERRALYLRIGLAGFAFGNVMLFSIPRYANGAPLEPAFQRLFDTLNLALAIPVLLYSAAPYFQSARHALRARVMSLDIPVALGLLVLFVRSVVDITTGRGEGFFDSFSGLVFFLLIGRLFQQKAFEGIGFDRTVRSFLPLSIRVERVDAVRLTAIERVVVGDVMVVRPQEIVPADAVLLDDAGTIDYAFATGESVPSAITRGESVAAGGRVVGRALRLRVVRPVSQSRLVALWNDPVFSREKARWLTEVSGRFGGWFTAVALALAAIGVAIWWPDAGRAASVATAVLIIACPCALTLAAPITLGTAMGMLGRAGCYLKHPAVALDLSRVDTVAFDKTGTLTTTETDTSSPLGGLSDRDRHLVGRLAAESIHPISRALAGRRPATGDVTGVREVPGHGLIGWIDGHHVVVGSAALVGLETGHKMPDTDHRTWAAVDGSTAGWMDFDDRSRPGTNRAVQELSRRVDTWLLSGDHPAETAHWSSLFGRRVRFGMTPEDKLALVRERQASGHHVLMVGDGLNDAGALRAADVGMAVSDNTACLVPACDAVIGGDRVVDLPAILAYARRARHVIVLCFAVSIAYNAIGLSFALAGRLTPLATAILMPVSSLTVVGLSVGLMRWRAPRPVTAS